MSLNIIVKQEPDSTNNDENGDTSEPITDFPLNLSNKNTSNNDKTQKNAEEIHPEFVNIKMELDTEDTNIKQEPSSDSEETQHTHDGSAWTDVSIKSEPLDQSFCEVQLTVGDRAIETRLDDEHLTEGTGPNTSNDDENEEEALSLNAISDGKYMCPICHKRFANKSNVQRHQLLHTREKLECHICLRTFMKPAHLQRHVLGHSVVKTYPCLECEKVFRSSSNLEQHKKTHLADKPYKCDVCKRQFSVRHNLVKHQGTKRCKLPVTDPIVCNVCHKVFKKEFLLRSHLRKHTTEKPFTCEICQMSFKYKSTLDRHIQLHNGVKPFSCKVCMKTFTHAGLIKPHMRKHTGEKPYHCPICSKAFAHKHNMERHTTRHAKVKNLVCEICHKKFPKESRLRYHMRTHVNDKPFACKVCPKKFSHKQNIIRHYGRKHPGAVFDIPETDASVARVVWENVVMKKGSLDLQNGDSNEEYIIP